MQKKIYLRDRRKHASPNSAQTEAVMAGALDIRLAGDAWYFGELHKKPYIGDPIRKVEIEGYHKISQTDVCRNSTVTCGIWTGACSGLRIYINIP